MSFKEIEASEVTEYVKGNRQIYLEKTSIMGLVTFKNKEQSGAKSLISTLIENNVKVKMITGDHIFVAVQVAIELQIVQH